MRSLRPNSRGVIVQVNNNTPRATGHVKPLSKPTPVLHYLDKVIKGETPQIAVMRSNGGIGDVMMTVPTVKAIANKYNCKVDYGTDFNYLDGALEKVLRHIPYIGNIIPWQDIDMTQYNAVVDLACPCVVHEVPLAPPINRIDLFARHARIILKDTHIDYVITPEELYWAKAWMDEHHLAGKKVILVQPFSSTTRRDAPVQLLQNTMKDILMQDRNVRMVVITHNSDNDKQTSWNWAEISKLHNHDIRQIAAIMHHCNMVMCPDSAILHLAGALKKDTVTLFGPTDPRARVDHYPNAVAICPAAELKCWPCWYHPNCQSRNLCWSRLNKDDIVKVTFAVLNNQPLPQVPGLFHYGNRVSAGIQNPSFTVL